jgi:hypothetical protein
MESRKRYHVNICGGDFQHVKDCFRAWKEQALVYRRNQHMFEGKNEVRPLSDGAFSSGEMARGTLEQRCEPHDPYALAARVSDGERDIWMVVAAYQECS